MAECRLCQRDRTLCQSHIVPEFLYSPLYNDRDQVMGITGTGSRGWRLLQIGLRENLFCSDCEDHFNQKYEQPFQRWMIDRPLPERIEQDTAYTLTCDYKTFKLFHLSILFRVAVSTLPTFKDVNLGSHEDRIRSMILNQEPGTEWEYPIFGMIVLNGRGEIERRLLSRPESQRFEGHKVYGQIYNGVMWWTSVSSHRNDMFCRGGLQNSGKLTMIAVPWEQFGVVQDARRALQRTAET